MIASSFDEKSMLSLITIKFYDLAQPWKVINEKIKHYFLAVAITIESLQTVCSVNDLKQTFCLLNLETQMKTI